MTKTINLALQGGGAHGAYTWGVLDRLLQEESLTIEGISGTSAGAMNAAVMVSGYAQNKRDGARAALENFWRRISESGTFSPLQGISFLSMWNLDWSPAYFGLDMLSRLFSPYDLNPLNFNPLRDVLEKTLNVEALQDCHAMKLFIAATHVPSGQARVFKGKEVTIDAVLASACLPFLFQAVEIDGEPYWDGGYMGNPVIWPLIYETKCEDVLLVQINPLHRPGVPRSASEIINRMNEINFNASLIAEMRAIDFVKRLIDDGKLDRKQYKDMKVHLIYSPEELKELNASSKMNASWDFFLYLHGIGFDAADRWLRENLSAVNVKSTLDIREKFLCKPVPA